VSYSTAILCNFRFVSVEVFNSNGPLSIENHFNSALDWFTRKVQSCWTLSWLPISQAVTERRFASRSSVSALPQLSARERLLSPSPDLPTLLSLPPVALRLMFSTSLSKLVCLLSSLRMSTRDQCTGQSKPGRPHLSVAPFPQLLTNLPNCPLNP